MNPTETNPSISQTYTHFESYVVCVFLCFFFKFLELLEQPSYYESKRNQHFPLDY